MTLYALFYIHTSATDVNDILKRNSKDFKCLYYADNANIKYQET